MFSILLSIFVVLVIIFECFLGRGTSSSLSEGFQAGKERTSINVSGIFNSLPIIIFSYMYQLNVPAIYSELENPNLRNIKAVLIVGTIVACLAYIAAGMFGFMSFTANISDVDYQKTFNDVILFGDYADSDGKTPLVIYISLFGMCFVVTFAAPFCILPTKDSIEEVRGKKFTPKENVVWTILLVVICCLVSCPFSTLSTPISILGATTNSGIGFLLPIWYYMHVERKAPRYTNMKITCYLIFVFFCVSSAIELYTITMGIINTPDDEKQ